MKQYQYDLVAALFGIGLVIGFLLVAVAPLIRRNVYRIHGIQKPITICENCKYYSPGQATTIFGVINAWIRAKCLGAPPKSKVIDFVTGFERIEYRNPKDVNKGNCKYFEQAATRSFVAGNISADKATASGNITIETVSGSIAVDKDTIVRYFTSGNAVTYYRSLL